MKQISSLFEKYKTTLRPPQASVEKEVVLVIGEVSGIKLRPDQVSYVVGSRTVSLHIPSIIKTEVMLQKTLVLDRLRSSLGATHAPRDLR